MANQQLVLVDVALKDLELHSACVDPSVNLREDLAILVHNAACRLADVCHPQIMDYQAVARQQLFEKLQVGLLFVGLSTQKSVWLAPVQQQQYKSLFSGSPLSGC